MKAITRAQKVEVLSRLLTEWETHESYFGDVRTLPQVLNIATDLSDTEFIDSLYKEYMNYEMSDFEGLPEWHNFDKEEIEAERKKAISHASGKTLDQILSDTFGWNTANRLHVQKLIHEFNDTRGC